MIRSLLETDLEKILEIENECFASPWNKKEFLMEMQDKTGYLSVLEEEKIVGYIDFHLIGDFAELYNIAVSKEEQKKGYGQTMLDYMFKTCEQKVERIFLEVRASNPALELYKKNGFKENRIRRNYYGDEDAVEMVKELK